MEPLEDRTLPATFDLAGGLAQFQTTSGRVSTLTLVQVATTFQITSSTEAIDLSTAARQQGVQGEGTRTILFSAASLKTLNLSLDQNDLVLIHAQGMTATINISNPSFSTTLVVDDSNDATGRTSTVSSFSVTGLGPTISFAQAHLSSLNVIGGRGSNVFNVTTLGGRFTTTLDTGGLYALVTVPVLTYAGGFLSHVPVTLAQFQSLSVTSAQLVVDTGKGGGTVRTDSTGTTANFQGLSSSAGVPSTGPAAPVLPVASFFALQDSTLPVAATLLTVPLPNGPIPTGDRLTPAATLPRFSFAYNSGGSDEEVRMGPARQSGEQTQTRWPVMVQGGRNRVADLVLGLDQALQDLNQQTPLPREEEEEIDCPTVPEVGSGPEPGALSTQYSVLSTQYPVLPSPAPLASPSSPPEECPDQVLPTPSESGDPFWTGLVLGAALLLGRPPKEGMRDER